GGGVDEVSARGRDRERAAHGHGEPQADPEAAGPGGPGDVCQRTSTTGHRFTSRAVSRTLAVMCRASAGCAFGDRDLWGAVYGGRDRRGYDCAAARRASVQ